MGIVYGIITGFVIILLLSIILIHLCARIDIATRKKVTLDLREATYNERIVFTKYHPYKDELSSIENLRILDCTIEDIAENNVSVWLDATAVGIKYPSINPTAIPPFSRNRLSALTSKTMKDLVVGSKAIIYCLPDKKGNYRA